MRLLCRGTSAAALKRLGLRLLGHDHLGATNFGLGAAGNDTRIGPGNARIGSKNALGAREGALERVLKSERPISSVFGCRKIPQARQPPGGCSRRVSGMCGQKTAGFRVSTFIRYAIP